MKFLWIIIFCWAVTESFGQATTLLNRSTISIGYTNAAGISGSDNYDVTVTRTSNGKFETSIIYIGGGKPYPKAQVFTISALRSTTFENAFVKAVQQIGTPANIIAGGNYRNVKVAATQVYHSLVLQNSLNPPNNKGPKAGEFIINPAIPIYGTIYKNSRSINRNVSNLGNTTTSLANVCTTVCKGTPFVQIGDTLRTVYEVKIVIYNGFINEITAVVGIGGQKYHFINPIPIGITSLRDINCFDKYYLRCYNPNNQKTPNKKYIDYVLNLAELLSYVPETVQNVFDRSPRNATHIIKMNQIQKKIYEVFKEPLSRLIQATVYSDFIGFEETKPNGLIQTELYRRMNMNTQRNQLIGSKRMNWGGFQYLKPELVFSKIEDKERILPLSYLTTSINGIEKQHAYLSTIDLHQHKYMHAGSLFNILLLQDPNVHSTLELNTGGYFGFVALEDTMRLNPARSSENNQYTIATIEAFLEAKYEFSKDEYFGFDVGYRPFFIANLGNYQMQIKDSEKFVTNPASLENFFDRAFLGQIELLAWVKPAPKKSDGRLFARYRLIHQMTNINLYYHQIQIGYSFYFNIPRP